MGRIPANGSALSQFPGHAGRPECTGSLVGPPGQGPGLRTCLPDFSGTSQLGAQGLSTVDLPGPAGSHLHCSNPCLHHSPVPLEGGPRLPQDQAERTWGHPSPGTALLPGQGAQTGFSHRSILRLLTGIPCSPAHQRLIITNFYTQSVPYKVLPKNSARH